MTFYDRAVSLFGEKIMACSSVMDLEPSLDAWYPGPGKTLLEIGTYNGLSTAFFSWHFDRVITVDVAKQALTDRVLESLARPNVVKAYIVPDNPHKKLLVNKMDFDFGFVDGDHSRAGALFDWALLQRCGLVLFHDYDRRRYMRVVNAVDSLTPPAKVVGPRLALWHGDT